MKEPHQPDSLEVAQEPAPRLKAGVILQLMQHGGQTGSSNPGVSNSFLLGPHQPHSCLQRAECNFRSV